MKRLFQGSWFRDSVVVVCGLWSNFVVQISLYNIDAFMIYIFILIKILDLFHKNMTVMKFKLLKF